MVLVLDNYDSFTFNLVQALGAAGAELHVVRNDALSVDEVRNLAPERIVIGPGPCTPREAGISVELIRSVGPEVPTLGVCLGHQAIGEAFGGATVRAPEVMHGKTSRIRHTGEGIFAGIPDPVEVTRYHSLITDASRLPPELEVIAWCDEEGEVRVVQGMRHRTFPVWGVQFHPESLFTQEGQRMLENFLRLG